MHPVINEKEKFVLVVFVKKVSHLMECPGFLGSRAKNNQDLKIILNCFRFWITIEYD